MGIRASSGGQLGATIPGNGGTLTPTQVQEIISQSVDTSNLVNGLNLTSAYDPATGKITISLGTQGTAIPNVVPASVVVDENGSPVGSATAINFTGPGVQSVTVANDIATVNMQGGGGSGAIEVSQDGGSATPITNLNFNGASVTINGNEANIAFDGGSFGVGSVNGQTGTVILNTDEVPEGASNLYFTNLKFDSRFNTKSTDNLAEGTGNLYFTNARFDNRLASKTTDNIAQGSTNLYFTNSNFDARFNTKTTDQITEGVTNRYYTDTRARNAISVVKASGDGSIAINNATGVITYTGPSAAEVQSHFSAGTGVTFNAGQIGVANIPNSALTNNSITVAGHNVALGGTVGIAVGDLSNVDLVTTAPSSGQALVWNGTKWVPGAPTAAGTVSSVNGHSGIVTLSTSDVAEGTNHYYTTVRANTDFDARFPTAFDTGLATKSTTNLAEGSNLYYTDGRVAAKIATTNLNALADVDTTAPQVGQTLKWNGTKWAPATDLMGAGVFSVSCQINYDPSGNLISVTVLNGTATATITNATSSACEVTFNFTGASRPPLTSVVYGYQQSTNLYIQRAVDPNFTKRQIAGGGTSGSPTAFTAFDATTNAMVLSLTKALTGASAPPGTATHCVVQFILV